MGDHVRHGDICTMDVNKQGLDYPFGEAVPDPGSVRAVLEDVYWLRMPLPFALDHINLWLLRDEIDGRAGWTVVDCGVARDEVRGLWERVFASALDGLPVLRVVVTHMHPDHVGLAHWLCERWQAPLWMTMTDYVTARLWSGTRSDGGGADRADEGEAAVRHFADHGMVDTQALAQIRERVGSYYPALVPAMPGRFTRIMDNDRLRIGKRDWQVIVGYGHAPEHASLHCRESGVLISGDMILPRISTNISVFAQEPEANPLPLYLRSLGRYQDLVDDTLVLPSHGRPFRGLHERIAQQYAHHAERLGEVIDACRTQARCAAEIVPIMFRRQLDLHQLTFAMGEAIAHLNALFFDGHLRRERGSDDIVRYRTT